MQQFEETGALERVVFFLNLADDPTVERSLTPRCALTAAEYLAFEKDLQVLVVLTDMTNYCEALREVSTAREEVPGRRGYPGLHVHRPLDASTSAPAASRAARARSRSSRSSRCPTTTSRTRSPTSPATSPRARSCSRASCTARGIFPPIDVLPCLSRLMNLGIGEGKTREDHRAVANQLYAAYAQGRDLRQLVAIVGEEALSELDRAYLAFADQFEDRYHRAGERGPHDRGDARHRLGALAGLPVVEPKRIKPESNRPLPPTRRGRRHRDG